MAELVSVVILNWNGESYLRECLNSVLAQDYQPVEIILVDNGSSDRSVEIAETEYPGVKLIQTGKNLGFAAGNNVGIREALGEQIVIFNNDAEMDRTCVSEMIRAIRKDERYGACATKIYLKDGGGLLDAAGIAICLDGLSIGRGRLEPGDRYDREEEVFFASGCCMMCRKEMLDDVVVVRGQYFDESFFMYADDTDLGWRARLRAWKTIYTPKAVAYHVHSASSADYSPLKAFLVERNRIWIQWTYFSLWMIAKGQVYTFTRYLFQAYGAFAGKGAAGGFTRGHSKASLVKVLCRVWGAALKGLPDVRAKREAVREGRSVAGRSLVREVLEHYGVPAREIGLKE
jgi:GT2 family glycosyltransferase